MPRCHFRPLPSSWKNVSPRNRASIARSNDSGGAVFETYPRQPIFFASPTCPEVRFMEKRRIGVSLETARILRAASNPSMFGMEMSSTMRSGFSAIALSTASTPSPASPHTSVPSRPSRIARTPFRSAGKSSAIRIRAAAISVTLVLLPSDHNTVKNACAGSATGPNAEDGVLKLFRRNPVRTTGTGVEFRWCEERSAR